MAHRKTADKLGLSTYAIFATVSVIGCVVSGCTSAQDNSSSIVLQTPDAAVSQLETAARELAAKAVAPSPTVPLASGSGQADRRAQVTLTGFRGHWPLTLGAACHGEGTVNLHVATNPVTLSCTDDQTHTLQLSQEHANTDSLTVEVEKPTANTAAWAVAVFGSAAIQPKN